MKRHSETQLYTGGVLGSVRRHLMTSTAAMAIGLTSCDNKAATTLDMSDGKHSASQDKIPEAAAIKLQAAITMLKNEQLADARNMLNDIAATYLSYPGVMDRVQMLRGHAAMLSRASRAARMSRAAALLDEKKFKDARVLLQEVRKDPEATEKERNTAAKLINDSGEHEARAILIEAVALRKKGELEKAYNMLGSITQLSGVAGNTMTNSANLRRMIGQAIQLRQSLGMSTDGSIPSFDPRASTPSVSNSGEIPSFDPRVSIPSSNNSGEIPSFDPRASNPGDDSDSADQATIIQEIRGFSARHLRNLAGSDADAYASDFADGCYYQFAKGGRASRRFISEDRAKLFTAYPRRTITLIGNPEILGAHAATNTAVLTYSYRYDYSGKKRATGAVKVTLNLEKRGGGWFIARFREQKI